MDLQSNPQVTSILIGSGVSVVVSLAKKLGLSDTGIHVANAVLGGIGAGAYTGLTTFAQTHSIQQAVLSGVTSAIQAWFGAYGTHETLGKSVIEPMLGIKN